MNDFQFYYPANVTFGRDAELKVGETAKTYGSKVLLHYDAGDFLEESGLLARVRESLQQAGCTIVELGGVRPNPRVSLMRQGVEICRNEGIDCVIGVGGGSTMDSSKAICVGAYGDKDILEYCGKPFTVEGKLPLIVIPTMSGTGSEISICAMICDDESTPEVKYSILDFNLIPDATLYNPALQFSLPANQTASGCMDIISHTLTTWFTDTPNVYIGDRLGESVIETVMHYAPIAIEHPDDYDARSQIAVASSLAVILMIGYDRQGREVSHTIENGFTTMHMIAHGTGLAILTPALMKYTYKRDLPRFALFATRLMGVENDPFDIEGTAREGVIRFEQFIRDRLKLPTRMSDIGLAESTDVDVLIERIKQGQGFPLNPGSVYELSEEDVRNIYELAR